MSTERAADPTTYEYDADGNIVSQTNANGTTTSIDVDDDGRVSAIDHAFAAAPTTPFAAFTYGRDALGHLSSAAATGVPTDDHTWTYDVLDRLLTDSAATGPYDYDSADNLAQLASGRTQAFDGGNQLCWSDSAGAAGNCSSAPSGATTFAYDNRGDRTSATTPTGTTTFAYNLERELKSVTNGGTTTSYGYNADGLRTNRTVGSTTTAFVWNLGEDMPRLLKEGSTAYVYGADGLPLEQVSGSVVLTYHHDQLGSTRAITDSAANVVATYTYDPYGNLAASTGSVTNPYGWAGEYRDAESGLTYLRARYYDPGTAQFLNRDPLVDLTRQPYAYADNNPLNETDPLGLCSVVATLNPFSEDNCLRTAAEHGSPVSKAIETFDPAYHMINGYYNEWQAAENGCSGWTVAKYGAEGVIGAVGTVGVAGAGAEVAGFIENPDAITELGGRGLHLHYDDVPHGTMGSHLQLDTWLKGVSGSGQSWRFPWPPW
jgi:RHS repeat-associated protein